MFEQRVPRPAALTDVRRARSRSATRSAASSIRCRSGCILLSSLVGVVIGALPGLTATMGIALMTTLTIKMPPSQALLVLICTYVGAIYGGSRSAILLNIPGTPASAASVPRRPRARAAGPRRPRDGHRDVGLGARHADRHVLPRAVHAGAGRARAQVRRLRVLLARVLRRRHRRHADRRRSAQGLDRRASLGILFVDASARRRSTRTTASRSATATSPAASTSCPRWSARSGSPSCWSPCARSRCR